MSKKKIEKIIAIYTEEGNINEATALQLVDKINEIVDVLNGEDEEKLEGFQGPRGEPGVPGAGEWGKSKEWKKLCSLIGYHPQDGRLTLIIKLVENEKKKSYVEGRKDALEDILGLEKN